MLFVENPECSTCHEARKWLDDHGFEYENRNIIEDGLSASELRNWQLASGRGVGRFINGDSKLFRETDLRARIKCMSNIQLFQLLASDGTLVNCPILVDEKTVLVGFDEQEWADKLLDS
ncbi:MAG: Spx/MgsR family RNA polymerase-binding regulatory protein [Eggerthellaceae bacterium]|nr:Spx/MgsR family RNA polymerase-binding regulatory protein [Eggerthellaceae bacterium]